MIFTWRTTFFTTEIKIGNKTIRSVKLLKPNLTLGMILYHKNNYLKNAKYIATKADIVITNLAKTYLT